MDSWLLRNLACPIDKSPLTRAGNTLRAASGRQYPIVDDVPILIPDGVEPTIPLALASIGRAKESEKWMDQRAPHLFLESLGISEEQMGLVASLDTRGGSVIDPVVQVLVGATSGLGYRHLIGKLVAYPIPSFPLKNGTGKTLLDIGCSWGRWSIAAGKQGYKVVGIDPSLGAIMAARRVCAQIGAQASFVVGDARYLPFQSESLDVAFSYSVLQHFEKENAALAIGEIGRTLLPGGASMVQLASSTSVRAFIRRTRQRYGKKQMFQVRYWSPDKMCETFERLVGPTSLCIDGLFGLGLQESDYRYLSASGKVALRASNAIRRLVGDDEKLLRIADSLYVMAYRK